MIAQQILNGLVVGSVYALFALGFTLIFGVHHILNMAHGAVFMWGAFFGLFAITRFDLPFPLGFVLAIVLAGLLSVALDWVAFRPLRRRGAPEFSAIVSSIGAGLVLMNIAQRVSDTRVLRYPFGTLPIEIYSFLGLRVTLIQAVMVLSTLLIVAALFVYLFYTRFGRQIRAVAINERTATLLGVNPNFVYFQTFFISGALAGAAGVLIGIAFNAVHFLMGDAYMLRAFVVIVLGGLGSVMGALIAGLLPGLVQTLTIAYVSSGLSDAIIFSILFVVLLVRPTGFFGTLRKEQRVARE
jgi:branched-chain amino acid transport system permease protein